jgi:uracil-DNA glycosylase family 4
VIDFGSKLIEKQYRSHADCWKGCKACSLYKQRDKVVLFRGSLPADFLFLGEAPGETEDSQGEPFVGRAGEVLQAALDLITEEVTNLGLEPFTYGISNIIACYPGKDANNNFNKPNAKQAEACTQRLEEVVELCDPRLIFLLGETAKQYGHRVCGRRTVGVYHPSFILRSGGIGGATYRSWWNSIAKEIAGVYAKV